MLPEPRSAYQFHFGEAVKKIFILEDDPARIMWFLERFTGYEVTLAESCTQLDRFVGPYDLVCLDHDLGGRQIEEHEDDGKAFAAGIKDQIGDACVLIHSFNADGARNIANLLPQAFIAPFKGRMFHALLPQILDEPRPELQVA